MALEITKIDEEPTDEGPPLEYFRISQGPKVLHACASSELVLDLLRAEIGPRVTPEEQLQAARDIWTFRTSDTATYATFGMSEPSPC